MKKPALRGCCCVTNSLCLVLIASMAIGVSLSFIVVSQVRAIQMVPASPKLAKGSAEYADCLWYSARNHGFYLVQSDLVSGDGTDDNRRLWLQFLNSIGTEECGSENYQIEILLDALANSASAADRVFLAEQ